jgi:hypothetical protein
MAKTPYLSRTAIALLCVGVLIVCLLSYGAVLFMKNISLASTIRGYHTQLAMYQRGTRNYPSEERAKFFEMQKGELNRVLARFQQYPLFWQRVIQRDMSSQASLKLKEEVFRVKTALRDAARNERVVLCNDIGFAQWEKSLPKAAQLENLFQALEVVKSVLEYAISARVTSVEEVSFTDAVVVPYEKSTKDGYYRRTVRVYFKADWERVARFIHSIQSAPLLLHVEELSISKEPLVEVKSGTKKGARPAVVAAEQGELYIDCHIANICL